MQARIVETPGFLTAKIAALIDVYHVTPFEVAKYTDWQIVHLYFHKRNKDGSMKEPDMAVHIPAEDVNTLEAELFLLDIWNGAGLLTNYEEARAALIAKYASKPTENGEDLQQPQ